MKTPEQRSAQARHAANVRWARHKRKKAGAAAAARMWAKKPKRELSWRLCLIIGVVAGVVAGKWLSGYF